MAESSLNEVMRRATELDERRQEQIRLQKGSIDRLAAKLAAVRELAHSKELVNSAELLAILDKEG